MISSRISSRIKRGLYLATFIAVVALQSAVAQHIVPEDLRRCLELGLSENYELQIIRGEAEQAANNASFSNSGMLPTLGLSGCAGGDFDSVNNSTKDNTYQQNDLSADLGVNLDWTLFDGFEVKTNYERYQELALQGEVASRIAVEDYIASLTAEYYNYIQQTNRLRNLNMAVELSKERLRIVRARYLVGNFSRLDYQQANVDFNVDSADYIKQLEVLKSSAITLNELMTVSDTNAEVPITDTLITLDASLDYKGLLYAMQENNAEILYAERTTNIKRLDYKKVLARNYPYAKLYADYGVTYNKYNGTTKYQVNRLGAGAGINIGMTIFDPTRKTAKRNAQISIKNAELNQKDVELKLNSQLNNLWQAYMNNIGLLHLEKSSLGAAKENFEIARERYMLGNLSGIEMREAQKSLLDAEDRILTATYNTKVCEISLMQISGQISKYLGSSD